MIPVGLGQRYANMQEGAREALAEQLCLPQALLSRIAAAVAYSALVEGRGAPWKAARLLIAGPSGTGKTLAAKAAAECYWDHVAFVACSELTPQGYAGWNLADVVGAHIPRGAHGVVILDALEWLANEDALASAAVQSVVLQLLDGSPLIRMRPCGRLQRVQTNGLTVIATCALPSAPRVRSLAEMNTALLSTGLSAAVLGTFTHHAETRIPTPAQAAARVLAMAARIMPVYVGKDAGVRFPEHLAFSIAADAYASPLGLRIAERRIHEVCQRLVRRPPSENETHRLASTAQEFVQITERKLNV